TRPHEAGVAALRALFPQSLDGDVAHAQAIHARAPINIADAQTDPRVPEAVREQARTRGYRSWATVPLLRHDEAIGTIAVPRRHPGGFTDDEIALLKPFADQAVIAIENVRLFTELEARNRDLTEALDQQTATSEILRVISSSPTDIHPVLDAVAASAARLCEAYDAEIYRVDGDTLRLAAHYGSAPSGSIGEFKVPLIPGTVGGRSVLERRTIHVHDLQAAADEFPEGSAMARGLGPRTPLRIPLLREGTALGVIAVRRNEVRPFTDKQIALVRTFADQAVIAVENVRLFTELQEKNRALTQAHAQVTET